MMRRPMRRACSKTSSTFSHLLDALVEDHIVEGGVGIFLEPLFNIAMDDA